VVSEEGKCWGGGGGGGGQEELDKIHYKFCKKISRLPRCPAGWLNRIWKTRNEEMCCV